MTTFRKLHLYVLHLFICFCNASIRYLMLCQLRLQLACRPFLHDVSGRTCMLGCVTCNSEASHYVLRPDKSCCHFPGAKLVSLHLQRHSAYTFLLHLWCCGAILFCHVWAAGHDISVPSMSSRHISHIRIVLLPNSTKSKSVPSARPASV